LKYARWEEHQGQKDRSRAIFERALGGELSPEEHKRPLLVAFAKFEERCKEYDRARCIYQYAIDQSAANGDLKELEELKTEFVLYEKRHGTKAGIEDIILNNRRGYYESVLREDRYGYDTWFDLIRLEESEVIELRGATSSSAAAAAAAVVSLSDLKKAICRCRDVYERAIENIPPLEEKRYWRRYIYLWISYAIFEELYGGDVGLSSPDDPDNAEEEGDIGAGGNTKKVFNGIQRARAVYKECLKIIPHKSFTFAKIWLEAATLEIRDHDLTAARRLLGTAIGLCPKEKLFKSYIDLELQLGEIERCRSLYGKYLEFMPFNCTAWKAYTQLEINVGEMQRARYGGEIRRER
jgi:crooked neck